MKFFDVKTVLAGLLLLSAAPAQAIVANDPYGLGNAEAFGELPLFDSVVAIFDSGSSSVCTGSLISSNTIATARHCTDGMSAATTSVYFGNNLVSPGYEAIYSADSFTPLSTAPGLEGEYFNGTDLAIITLTEEVTGYTPYKLFAYEEGETPESRIATLAGFGNFGVGSTGPVNGLNFQIRGGQNVMDGQDTFSTPGGDNTVFYADFDDPEGDGSGNVLGSPVALENEVLVGGGDSGGPLMFFEEGEWLLAGVLVGTFDSSFDGIFGNYGDFSAWTGFQSTEAQTLLTNAGAQFAVAAVPLPASAALLIGALGALRLTRRKRTV